VVAFAVLVAMVWLDWNFPTEMFYSPNARANQTVSSMLLFKRTIEIGLSLFWTSIAVTVLLWKRSGNAEKLLATAAIGAGVGFWLHRDLVYLLLH
jgi:hypothetical protein